MLEHLWSPWRLAYITGGDPKGCIFCAALSEEDAASLIVHRGRTCFVILNLFPYNNGHLMVVPNRHVADLSSASPAERTELIELTARAETALREAYAPHGMNMGINLGKPAGAGVLDHVHLHIVPRWNGDTNFMPVLDDVKIVNEAVTQTASKLREGFAKS